uniref:Uncharacterized protein n=1 Tax=Anguilla anguilla TaxID=7936 RepID=A0A0E9W949_ANGAN
MKTVFIRQYTRQVNNTDFLGSNTCTALSPYKNWLIAGSDIQLHE